MKRQVYRRLFVVVVTCLGAGCSATHGNAAATTPGPVESELEVVPVSENVYMLAGHGGNVGLSIGADGALIIDDKERPATDQLLAAVRSLTDQGVTFVVNTHWHTLVQQHRLRRRGELGWI